MGRAGSIPFLIGVTGHRDPVPERVSALRERFRQVLEGVHEAAPHTPILLLSGLAAGCDQLAARWALEWGRGRTLPDGSPALRVGGVLPMQRHAYLRDFEGDQASLQAFLQLEREADFVIVIPEPTQRGDAAVDPRVLQYERLGNFLAEQSQLLVAFFNGVINQKRGGTSHVVQTCKALPGEDGEAVDVPFRERRHVLALRDPTPVEIIDTPRISDGGDRAASSAAVGPATAMSVDSVLRRYLAGLDLLNRSFPRRRGRRAVPSHATDARSGLDRARERFEAVDGLASRAKAGFHWHVLGLTGLSVVAVGCFQWFASHDRQAWAAWTYLGLMLLAVAWYALLRRRRLEWVFVHARAMAEALRVQLAWTAAGVDDVVTDHYMSRRSIDTRFLREMIRAASIEAFVDAPGDAGGLAQEASGLAWVQGQIEYMAGRTEHDAAPSRLGHWVARLRRWSIQVVRGAMRAWWILILLVSLAMAVVSSGATPGAEHGSHDDHGGSLVAWLPFGAFLIGTLIFVKVGLEYHDGVVLAEEDEESYRRMLPVFRRAHALLGRADDTAERRRILRAVGKEALDEHAEWFVNHRHSLRMPSVG